MRIWSRKQTTENKRKRKIQAVFNSLLAVFRAQVVEKEQHTAHCKSAEIVEFYTLQISWMASDEWENEEQFNADYAQNQHFIFGSRKGPSECF